MAADVCFGVRYRPRRSRGDHRRAYAAGPDRDADRARRCRLERPRNRRCASRPASTSDAPNDKCRRCSRHASVRLAHRHSALWKCALRQRTGNCGAHRRGNGRQIVCSLPRDAPRTWRRYRFGGANPIRPRNGYRAIQGISSAHPGGCSGSDGVFCLSREGQRFHVTGLQDPHAGESWRGLYRCTRSARGSVVAAWNPGNRGPRRTASVTGWRHYIAGPGSSRGRTSAGECHCGG